MSTLYWWAVSDEKRGPVALEKLRELVRNGTIPRSSTIWCDGWEDWRSIESIAQSLAIPLHVRALVADDEPESALQSRGVPIAAKLVACVLVVGFIALGCTVYFWGTNPSEYRAAKRAVESRLKSPSTAVFSSGLNSTVAKSGDTVKVRGFVDSQNTFGAMLRSQWVVTLRGGEVQSVELLP